MTDLAQPTALASRRSYRAAATEDLAQQYGGVANRDQLHRVGISRDDIRHEIAAGRWELLGRQTVALRGTRGERACWWRAVWETHGSARLDGASALLSYGMTGWEESATHVSVPHGTNVRSADAVRIHALRHEPRLRECELPCVSPEWAALHAASWAPSERAATTLLAMAVQQRITTGPRIAAVMDTCARIRRIHFIREVVADITGGAQALSEIDFARLCRRYRIPEPTRQAVRRGHGGRIYLDASWENANLVVEIDGFQHSQGLAMIDDALRDNHLALGSSRVLRIPALGLRTCAEAFMGQIKQALSHQW